MVFVKNEKKIKYKINIQKIMIIYVTILFIKKKYERGYKQPIEYQRIILKTSYFEVENQNYNNKILQILVIIILKCNVSR